jgi:hypothetical protein
MVTTGLCSADPCETVRCATGQVCQVNNDGTGDCAIPVITGIAGTAKVSGSGIFACSLAARRTDSDDRHGLVNLVLALAAGMLIASRRRRR